LFNKRFQLKSSCRKEAEIDEIVDNPSKTPLSTRSANNIDDFTNLDASEHIRRSASRHCQLERFAMSGDFVRIRTPFVTKFVTNSENAGAIVSLPIVLCSLRPAGAAVVILA
jgi:hypothetical protein